MTSVKEHAYAKINLYLDVLSRRDDGFHGIKTVMHTVSLADEVTVAVKPQSTRAIHLSVSGNNKLPADSRNLAYRAAELFLDATLIDAEIHISLVKNIPIAAGLAGGSSDAAAVLRALNRAFKRPLTDKRLTELSAVLGSDVPYCLHGGTALCLGRGEDITRLPDTLRLHTVIAISDEHISTPAAYSRLDELYSNFEGSHDGEIGSAYAALERAASSGDVSEIKLYNIFENAILPICNGAEQIKTKLFELGASHALMSGSGPSVYGIFESEELARCAAEALTSLGCRAFYAHSI